MTQAERAFWGAMAGAPSGRILVAPVAPSAEDIGLFEARSLQAAAASDRPLRALMLGVTRQIAEMGWPEGTSLIAADWAPGMVKRWWRARPEGRLRAAVLADWRRLPLPPASQDIAVGDGCFAALASLDECAAVSAEIRRVLRPRGWCVLRCFVRPEVPERLDDLFADLFEGRIRAPEAFCMRLAMAVHDSARRGARRNDAWRAFEARIPDRAALLARLAWPEQALAMVERWRDSQACLAFPTLGELRELVGRRFELTECSFAGYELGERCARVVLRARP
ncbi:MAG TPA: methyltransferase domain-containing protein [Burkholderiales bacterium]|nr:methyltransferase domain-containing protein [Burkholderiales bacterium]